jgi:hypothetical protein
MTVYIWRISKQILNNKISFEILMILWVFTIIDNFHVIRIIDDSFDLLQIQIRQYLLSRTGNPQKMYRLKILTIVALLRDCVSYLECHLCD